MPEMASKAFEMSWKDLRFHRGELDADPLGSKEVCVDLGLFVYFHFLEVY